MTLINSIKYNLFKYINEISYILVYFFVLFLWSLIPARENEQTEKLIMTNILTILIVGFLIFLQAVCGDYRSTSPIELLFTRKSFFQYKGQVFFTTNKDQSIVKIFKLRFFKYPEVGSTHNTNNQEEYKTQLKRIVDDYIEKDLQKKLEKRTSKYKFNEFNEIN